MSKQVVITDMASVVLYDDFRELLYKLGYGAVRADGDTVHVYDLNPDMKLKDAFPPNAPPVRFKGFMTLFVKEQHRCKEGEKPGPREDGNERCAIVARVTVDEGRFDDVMGNANMFESNPPWTEVVDAWHVYYLIAQRLGSRIKGSQAIGRGRGKTEEIAQYFEAFTKQAKSLQRAGIRLGRRVRGEKLDTLELIETNQPTEEVNNE